MIVVKPSNAINDGRSEFDLAMECSSVKETVKNGKSDEEVVLLDRG